MLSCGGIWMVSLYSSFFPQLTCLIFQSECKKQLIVHLFKTDTYFYPIYVFVEQTSCWLVFWEKPELERADDGTSDRSVKESLAGRSSYVTSGPRSQWKQRGSSFKNYEPQGSKSRALNRVWDPSKHGVLCDPCAGITHPGSWFCSLASSRTLWPSRWGCATSNELGRTAQKSHCLLACCWTGFHSSWIPLPGNQPLKQRQTSSSTCKSETSQDDLNPGS